MGTTQRAGDTPDSDPPGRWRPVRMCVRCQLVTETPVTVAEVHQNTGPGFNVYACPECAEHYPVPPGTQPAAK